MRETSRSPNIEPAATLRSCDGECSTLTDMSFDQFAEGAFDKGIRSKVLNACFIESSFRKVFSTAQPLSRGCAAHCRVAVCLSESVRARRVADKAPEALVIAAISDVAQRKPDNRVD